MIIRTASEGVSQEALERDVRRLQAQWEVVKTKSEQTGPSRPKAPALLYEEPDLLIKVVRDQFNEDFSRLVVQGDDAWDTLHGYLAHVAPELADRMHRHVGNAGRLQHAYRIDEQLLKALDRKVWLPSGGTLVIDRTEAMTVIDVNTGKFTGSGGNLEETVTRNNLEAAEEIVRQLRLRDIGGIIVIDFIDMVLEANRDLVLRRLTECLARDRTRHQVAEVTSLGLVQMTRKRVGGGLLEHFSTPCEHCRGRGVVVDTEAIEHAEPSKPDAGGGGRKSRGGRGRRGDGETNGHHGNGRSANGSGRLRRRLGGRPLRGGGGHSRHRGGGQPLGRSRRDRGRGTRRRCAGHGRRDHRGRRRGGGRGGCGRGRRGGRSGGRDLRARRGRAGRRRRTRDGRAGGRGRTCHCGARRCGTGRCGARRCGTRNRGTRHRGAGRRAYRPLDVPSAPTADPVAALLRSRPARVVAGAGSPARRAPRPSPRVRRLLRPWSRWPRPRSRTPRRARGSAAPTADVAAPAVAPQPEPTAAIPTPPGPAGGVPSGRSARGGPCGMQPGETRFDPPRNASVPW